MVQVFAMGVGCFMMHLRSGCPVFLLIFLALPLFAQEADPREKRQIDFALGLYQRGDYREAAAEFEAYLSNPDWRSRREAALFFSAESFRQLKQSDKAQPRYLELLQTFPESSYLPVATYRIAEVHLEKREGKLARERLEALLARELTADLSESVHYALGLAYSLEGESSKAIEWWKKGREKFPEGRTRLQIALGVGLESFRIGNWEEARSELETWIAASEPSAAGAYPDALAKLAEAQEKTERFEEAGENWLKLADLAADPGVVERALVAAARNAFRLEKWAELDKLAPRLAAAASAPAARLQVDLIYGNRHYRNKDWDEAAERYSAALASMDDIPVENADERKALREETLVRYGWCLFALKNWDLLQSVLQPLAEGPSPPAEAVYLLAEAWKEKGDAAEAVRWYEAVPEDSDLARVSRRSAADLAFASEDWRVAADLYLTLSEKTEDPAERLGYRLRAADGYRKLERFARSAELYAQVRVESSSETVREKAAYLEGWSLQRGGESEKAIEALENFRKLHPESEFLPEGLFLLGQAYDKTGDLDSAVTVLESLRAKFPDSDWTGEGLLLLAAAYSKKGEFDHVLESLVEFQSRFPKKEMNTAYALWLARALVDRARFEEALVTLEKLASRDLAPEGREDLLFLLGEALRNTGEEQSAVDSYRKYLEEFPEGRRLPAVYLGLGISRKRLGEIESAREASRKALDLVDSGAAVDPALEAQIHLLAGDLAFEEGDYSAAYRFYAKPSILVRHPIFTPIALARSAECKEKMGDAAQAQTLREELLRDYPDSEAAKVVRGRTVENGEGE